MLQLRLLSMMKKWTWLHWAFFAFSAAIVLVSVRVYFLDVTLPHSHYICDSVDIAINAVCINAFGKDEWNISYPVVGFRSFGEYKSPLYIYLLALIYRIAPPGVSTARIFSMLLGLAGIALLVSHARKLMEATPYYTVCASFFGLALLSSWIMAPHRMPVEVTLCVLLIAMLFIITHQFLRRPASLSNGILLGLITGLLPYLYSATKPFYALQLPLAAFCLFSAEGIRGLSWKNAKGWYVAVALAVLMGLPVFIDLCTTRHFLARYQDVREGNILHILANYFLSANPVFWFFKGDANFRHHTGFLGMLNPVFAPFLALGFFSALRRLRQPEQRPYLLYLLLFLVLSFVPAAMSRAEELPHAMRTLIAVPGLLLLCFLGADALYKWCVRWNGIRTFFVLGAVMLVVGAGFAALNVSHYLAAAKEPAELARTYEMPRPNPSWRQEKRLTPCWDRSPESMSYRYFRLIVMKDYCYCLPPPGY